MKKFLVEQFRGDDWRFAGFGETNEEAERLIAYYQRNNPGGRFRIRIGRVPRCKGPMEIG